MKEEYKVSLGLEAGLKGLQKFLKKNKNYDTLQCNIYTVARNVLNSSDIDVRNITSSDIKKFKEAILSEVSYLLYKVPLKVTFYKPKINRPVKVVIGRRATKLSLSRILIYDVVKTIKLKYEPIGNSILLTNMLAGILNKKNLILRSFTGDVISKEQYYKLLIGQPKIRIVNQFLYETFGDDMVAGVDSKLKKKIVKFFRENSFKKLPINLKKV